MARAECRFAIEIDDVDANCGGETRGRAVAVYLGDEIVHRDVLAACDILQRVPHRRFKTNAGPMTAHHDIVDRERGGRTVMVAA